MQGNAANVFLKYHRKLLFFFYILDKQGDLQKAQLGLAVRTAVRAGMASPGVRCLEPLQGKVDARSCSLSLLNHR